MMERSEMCERLELAYRLAEDLWVDLCDALAVERHGLGRGVWRAVSYTHLTLPTNREV